MTDSALHIGDLFDPDDLVSQRVFTLSATVADLGIAESAFQDSLDNGTASHTGYHYRQLTARLYEAERVVVAIDQHDEVQGFIARCQYAAPAVSFLRSQYLPTERSTVHKLYGQTRHRTVHHSHVGSEELRDALAGSADQVARILVDTDKQRLYYEWPEAVYSHVLGGDLGTDDGRNAFIDRARLAQDILTHFAALLKAVLHPYVESVGIAVDRLYHDVREVG